MMNIVYEHTAMIMIQACATTNEDKGDNVEVNHSVATVA